MAFNQISSFWLSIIILCIGLAVPVQAGVNSQLGRMIHNPVFAAFISFLVGAIALLGLMFFGQTPWPSADKLMGLPWWAWIGGLFAAFFVLGTVIVAPRLGATTALSLVVAGQMLASLYFDHYGMLGFPLHPASLMRIVGVVLLLVGVYLVQRF